MPSFHSLDSSQNFTEPGSPQFFSLADVIHLSWFSRVFFFVSSTASRTSGVNSYPVEIATELFADVRLAPGGQTDHHDDAWCDRNVGNVRAQSWNTQRKQSLFLGGEKRILHWFASVEPQTTNWRKISHMLLNGILCFRHSPPPADNSEIAPPPRNHNRCFPGIPSGDFFTFLSVVSQKPKGVRQSNTRGRPLEHTQPHEQDWLRSISDSYWLGEP